MNAMDLWQFTPLHEAASKNRVEVCSLLLSHGADPTLLNCHSKSAVDMAPTPELKERLTCELSHRHEHTTMRGNLLMYRQQIHCRLSAQIRSVTSLKLHLKSHHRTRFLLPSVCSVDEFKGHSLLQAAREADMAKVKKTLALEIISFKHPQTNETALVRNKH